MIRLKHILYEAVNTQHVINTNNEIKSRTYQILSRFKNNTFGQRDKIQNIVKNYVNELNSNASLIVKQVSSGKGAATANLYLDTLKQTFYKEFSNLSKITKFTITKYYNENELRTEIEKNISLIHEIYHDVMYTTLMYLHDPNVENEVNWYTAAWDTLHKRREAVIEHLIDWMISQLY